MTLRHSAALMAGFLIACTGCSLFEPSQQERLNQACGYPMTYPLSEQCIRVFGKYGPIMQRKSNLVVAAQTACTPSETQIHACVAAMDAQPSCRKAMKDKASKGNYDNETLLQCGSATEAECGFVEAAATAGGRPEDFNPACKEAKDDLKNFENDVQRAEIENAFAPAVVARPVIVSQPPTHTTCVPLGAAVTCHSW